MNDNKIEMFDLRKKRVIAEARAPSSSYSQIFVQDSFLYCVNPQAQEYVVFDIINRCGTTGFRDDTKAVLLTAGQVSGLAPRRDALSVCFFGAFDPFCMKREKNVVIGVPKVVYPLIVQQTSSTGQQIIGIAQIDAAQLLQDIGQCKTLPQLLQLFYICCRRSGVFVQPFLE